VLERLRAADFAEAVTDDISQVDRADALILLDGFLLPDGASSAALREVRSFYQELRWRQVLVHGGLQRYLARLRAAGLMSLRAYHLLPSPVRCQVYAPADSPQALRWYLRHVFSPHSPRKRLLGLALDRSTRFPQPVRQLTAPYFGIVGSTTASRPAAPELPQLCAGAGEDLFPLMLADGGNRVVILPFARGQSHPRLVLKVPKLPAVNNRTESEQRVLATVRHSVDEQLRASIPTPQGIVSHRGLSVAVETYLPGQSLKSLVENPRRSLADKLANFQQAADWLGEFHRQARPESLRWDAAVQRRVIDDVLARFEDLFGPLRKYESFVTRVRAHARTLTGLEFPIVWQHRDYNVWNIFRHRDRLYVIDWEGGRPGPALTDLLHCAISWNESARGLVSTEARLRGFESLFLAPDSDDRITSAIHGHIRCYLDRVGLDPLFSPLLLVYLWVELANRRYDQMKDQGILGSDPRQGNWNLDYVTLLATHADALFSGRSLFR
jgi:thiamine kinase-like enzyme